MPADGSIHPNVVRVPGIAKAAITDARWEEWKRNRDAASDVSNWTDGGHWMGLGKEPNAYDTLKVISSSVLVFEWPTNECVDKFRSQSSAIAQRIGWGYGALFGYLLRNHWVTGIVVGIASSFLLSKGGIKVNRGYSYRVDSASEITLSAHPWGEKVMHVTSTQTLYDERGEVIETLKSEQKIELKEYGDDLLKQLLAAHGNVSGAVTKITCPDANVIFHSS